MSGGLSKRALSPRSGVPLRLGAGDKQNKSLNESPGRYNRAHKRAKTRLFPNPLLRPDRIALMARPSG